MGALYDLLLIYYIILHRYYFIENPLGQAIIYVITFLFLIAIFNLVKSLYRYRRHEQRALLQLKRNAEVLDSGVELSRKRELLLQDVPKNSLAAQRVEAICDIIEKKQVADQEQLATIAYEKERSSLGILLISYISRTLILLGLLGTFIGLATIALKFNSILSSVVATDMETLMSSLAEASADMRNATGGLIIAFTTSLWGLVGTVFLGAGVLFLDHSQQNFLTQLEDSTARLLLPILNPPQMTQAIEESSRKLAESATEIRTTMEGLRSSAQRTYESMEKLDGIVSSFEATGKSFHGSASMINASQLKINETLADLGAKVSTADNREQSLFEKLGQALSQAVEQQKLLRNMLARLQEAEMLTEKILKECLVEISSEQEKFLNQLKQSESKLGELVQKVITKQESSYKSFLENVTKKNETIIQEVRDLSTEQAETVEQIKNQTTQNRGIIQEVRDLSKKQTEIGEQIKNQTTQNREIIQEVRALMSTRQPESVKQDKDREQEETVTSPGEIILKRGREPKRANNSSRDRPEEHKPRQGRIKEILGDFLKIFSKSH